MHEVAYAEIGIKSKLHHDNASNGFFGPHSVTHLVSELMLCSGIVTTKSLRMIVNHETS
jgi:hypothetical protein